jgi:hypothetical protein
MSPPALELLLRKAGHTSLDLERSLPCPLAPTHHSLIGEGRDLESTMRTLLRFLFPMASDVYDTGPQNPVFEEYLVMICSEHLARLWAAQ